METPIKEINLTDLKDDVAYNFTFKKETGRGKDVAYGCYIKERIDKIESVLMPLRGNKMKSDYFRHGSIYRFPDELEFYKFAYFNKDGLGVFFLCDENGEEYQKLFPKGDYFVTQIIWRRLNELIEHLPKTQLELTF